MLLHTGTLTRTLTRTHRQRQACCLARTVSDYQQSAHAPPPTTAASSQFVCHTPALDTHIYQCLRNSFATSPPWTRTYISVFAIRLPHPRPRHAQVSVSSQFVCHIPALDTHIYQCLRNSFATSPPWTRTYISVFAIRLPHPRPRHAQVSVSSQFVCHIPALDTHIYQCLRNSFATSPP